MKVRFSATLGQESEVELVLCGYYALVFCPLNCVQGEFSEVRD